MNPVAQRIQTLLDSRDEKMKPAAEKAGVSYYSVYPWWQRENSTPDPEKVNLWAKYFGVPVGHLLYGDPLDADPNDYESLLERAKSLEGDERRSVETILKTLLQSKTGSMLDQKRTE